MLGAVAAVAVAGSASAAKLEKYRYELSEFSGQSQAITAHEIFPCSPNIDAVSEGTLTGSFSSPLNGVMSVKIGKSDAKGKLVASAGPTAYQQGGVREGDYAPCGADDSQSFALPCTQSVATTPGIVGRLIDATKKKVQIDWTPTFDGVEARFTPDFNCIPKMGDIPMPTVGPYLAGACKDTQYPRKLFTGEDAFGLNVTCATDFIPFQNPVGLGTYSGNYLAQLTLEAVEPK